MLELLAIITIVSGILLLTGFILMLLSPVFTFFGIFAGIVYTAIDGIKSALTENKKSPVPPSRIDIRH